MTMKSPRYLISCCACGMVAIIALMGAFGGDAGTDLEARAIASLRKYRSWTKVNPQPVAMVPAVAQACASVAMAAQPAPRIDSGPHRDYYLTVYVNNLARAAMVGHAVPNFPVGSVVVKEKLKGKNATAPELMTVMLKREHGYNAASGDWEYISLDGSTRAVTAQGRLENCQGCHNQVAANDYIFRTYLPE